MNTNTVRKFEKGKLVMVNNSTNGIYRVIGYTKDNKYVKVKGFKGLKLKRRYMENELIELAPILKELSGLAKHISENVKIME